MPKLRRVESTYSIDVAGGTGGVVVPNSPSLNPTDYFAAEFCVFMKAGVPLLLVDNSQSGVTASFYIYVSGTGDMSFYSQINGVSRNLIAYRAPFNPNGFNKYGAMYDGTKIEIYANRERIATLAVTGTLGTNSGNMRFGQYFNGSQSFEGKFSIARIFHTNAYSFDSFLKFCDNEPHDASLWSTRVYDMDTSTGSGTTVNDLSGSGNVGTFSRAVWSTVVPFRSKNSSTGRVLDTARVLQPLKKKILKYSDSENVTREVSLQAWFMGNAVPGATDGSQPAVWPDQSGNGNDLGAFGSPTPTYHSTNISHILNGLPTFQFSGNQYFKRLTGLSGARCIFIVHRLLVEPANQTIVDGATSLASAMYRLSFNYRIFAGGAIGFISAGGTQWRVQIGNFSGPASVCGLDGQEVKGNLTDVTTPGITVGASGANTERITGNIAEVIVTNGALDDLKRRVIRRYLDAKYNL